jgi:hypothetical protein
MLMGIIPTAIKLACAILNLEFAVLYRIRNHLVDALNDLPADWAGFDLLC